MNLNSAEIRAFEDASEEGQPRRRGRGVHLLSLMRTRRTKVFSRGEVETFFINIFIQTKVEKEK